jgi:hypothetical protein
MKRTIALVFAAALVLALATPAFAKVDDDFENDLVVLTGNVRIDEDESFDDVVVFNGDLTTAGTIDGDLIATNGDVEITGTVTGDVVVFNGDATVRSGARVGGDLASRRDPVVEEGADVEGEIRQPSKDFFRPVEVFAARVALWVAATVSFLLLGLLLLALAPRGMDAIARVWETSKGSSALWGVILLIGLPIGAGLVMLTIVGIPFGIGTLLALGLIYSIAYVAGAWALGRSIVKAPSSRFLSFLAGFGIVRLLGLIPIAGGIISTLVLVFGLGVLILAIWRARKESTPAPAAA